MKKRLILGFASVALTLTGVLFLNGSSAVASTSDLVSSPVVDCVQSTGNNCYGPNGIDFDYKNVKKEETDL